MPSTAILKLYVFFGGGGVVAVCVKCYEGTESLQWGYIACSEAHLKAYAEFGQNQGTSLTAVVGDYRCESRRVDEAHCQRTPVSPGHNPQCGFVDVQRD